MNIFVVVPSCPAKAENITACNDLNKMSNKTNENFKTSSTVVQAVSITMTTTPLILNSNYFIKPNETTWMMSPWPRSEKYGMF